MGRVALVGDNTVEYISLLIDIWNKGDCAVLLDWRMPFHAILGMMREADAHICYIENKFFAKFGDDLPQDIAFFPFESTIHIPCSLPDDVYRKFKSNYSTDEAVVIYSSGTTGKCKGVILSHYAININAEAIIDYMKPALDDCIYIAKTLSHASTLIGELLVALKSNMRLIIAPIIVPPRCILNNIAKFKITVICVNPTLLSMCSDEYEKQRYDISSLRKIYVSGSILNDKIYNKAREIFGRIQIYNVYGLSEAGPRVTAQRQGHCKNNSVGCPIKNVKVKIVDEYGESVSNGKMGIIHVQTPCLFNGYIVGGNKCKSLCDGWLNTGDVGYFDDDEELHIVARIDDVIVIDSHKIYPNAVERQVLMLDGISECVVIEGVFHNKKLLVCLYTGVQMDERKIRNKLVKCLPLYEIPKRFSFSNNIPRNANGKIIKEEVCYLRKKRLELNENIIFNEGKGL